MIKRSASRSLESLTATLNGAADVFRQVAAFLGSAKGGSLGEADLQHWKSVASDWAEKCERSASAGAKALLDGATVAPREAPFGFSLRPRTVGLLLWGMAFFLLLTFATPIFTDQFTFAADDGIVLNTVRGYRTGGVSTYEFLMLAHADYLIPIHRLKFLLLHLLFGEDWRPFGFYLVCTAAAAAASVGYAIYRYSRDFVVAAVVTGLLAVSSVFSTGVVSIFAYSLVFELIVLSVLSLILAQRYASTGDRTSLWAVGVCLVLSLGLSSAGVMTVAAAAAGYASYRAAELLVRQGSGPFRFWSSRDLSIAAVLGGFLVLYLGLSLLGHLTLSNPLPGTLVVPDRSRWPGSEVLWRLHLHLAYGAFGWLWPESIVDHAQQPFAVLRNHLAALTATEVGLLLTSLWQLLQPGRKTNDDRLRHIGAVCVASLALVLVFAAIAFTGRTSVYWWNIRYQNQTVPMFALCMGLQMTVLARVVSRSPHGRWAFYGALLVGFAFLAYVDTQTVLHSFEYVRRFQWTTW